MRPVLVASFALFTAITSALSGNTLWFIEPAFALEDSSKAAAKDKTGHDFMGMADYYHHSLYGKKTASGQVLEKHLFTAAHRTLPFGTHVHVKNHCNGRSCIVVINDRGPFTKSKVIDLSHSAAAELDMIRAGTCKVGCTVVPKPKTGAGKVELAKTVAEKAVPEKTAVAKLATEKILPEKIVAEKPATVKIAAKPEAKLEAVPALRPAIAMKVTKDKPATTVSTDQFSRADETSAELEGAEPIKWSEVQ
jgi:rare lipoprotein A